MVRTSKDTGSIADEKKVIPMMTPVDRQNIAVFLLALAAGLIIAAVYLQFMDGSAVNAAVAVALPFAVMGLVHCIRNRSWMFLVPLFLVVAVMLSVGLDILLICVFIYISIGIIGVVSVVSIIQRGIFYKVLCSVEYLNVKEKLTLWDRVVAFMFNVSGDLDTRNLAMNNNLRRASTPWGEVRSVMNLAFMIGMFVWIYLCMNPSWMTIESFSGVPVSLFCMMLYIPVLVMPFAIFLSLNVRIRTKYRDFKLYDGIMETLKRMAIPIFAAFMFILLAYNKNGYMDVLGFILMSVLFNLFINGMACFVYYRYFEGKVVDSIVSKWTEFRPVDIFLEIEDDSRTGRMDVPDTPKRDTSSFGEMRFYD